MGMVERENETLGDSDDYALSIFSELLTNRDEFVKRVSEKLKEENPDLLKFVARSCMGSPEPEKSFGWVCAYYEIYSHVLEKNGKSVPCVSKKTLDSIIRSQLMIGEPLDQVDSKRIKRFFAKMDEKWEELERSQMGKDSNLACFWATLALYKTNLFFYTPLPEQSRYTRRSYVMGCVQPVYLVAKALEESARFE